MEFTHANNYYYVGIERRAKARLLVWTLGISAGRALLLMFDL